METTELGHRLDLLRKELAPLVRKREAIDAKINEITSDIQALERVVSRSLLGPVPDLPDSTGSTDDGVSSPLPSGEVRRAVMEVIDKMAEEFSPANVREALGNKHNSGSINNALRGLARDRDLVVVRRGSGKRAPVYRRPIMPTPARAPIPIRQEDARVA